MIFSSIFFIFIFLPMVLILFYIVPHREKNLVLFLASIIFYAWGEPVYIFLMIFSVLFNYVSGLDIEMKKEQKKGAKASLVFTIVVNLFLLGFFKYYGFLIDTVNGIFHSSFTYKTLALPIGISFYTFQTMSYIIDVYYDRVKAQRNFLNFGLYVTMFPQLIAGPIVKYIDIERQLQDRKLSRYKFCTGVEIFLRGLAKKVLLANQIGMLYENAMSYLGNSMSVLMAWMGMIAFTFQIYFDFSGYSDMAIGLGKMFGFDFLKNFDYPYQAKSITDFWRRWHISLSSWFREYVYIPLGGNRVTVGKHIRNLLIVWMLTGLWHGASWNFVLWGLYYGVILILEKYFLLKRIEKWPRWIQSIYTLFLVVIGWTLFSCVQINQVVQIFSAMFHIGARKWIDASALYYLRNYFLLFLLCGICSRKNLYAWYKKKAKKMPVFASIVNILIFLLCIAYLVYDTYNPFLYFRF